LPLRVRIFTIKRIKRPMVLASEELKTPRCPQLFNYLRMIENYDAGNKKFYEVL